MGAASMGTRVRTRIHRHQIDKELASGADPNIDSLRHERARELVGEQNRERIATSLERLLAEVDSGPRTLSSRAPIARAAIRESRGTLETIVERLKAPAYVSAQGVALISLLLSDGAGPFYGNDPVNSQVLPGALEAALDSIGRGPVLVG